MAPTAKERGMSFPVSLEIPVAWGDMDAFGHVNNTIFFRYFESTRIAYFRGVEDSISNPLEFHPIVASTRCDYLFPVVFPDTLTGRARVSRLGNSSFTMEYELTSRAQGKVVAKGDATIVNIDPTSGKSQTLPQPLREAVEALESSVHL